MWHLKRQNNNLAKLILLLIRWKLRSIKRTTSTSNHESMRKHCFVGKSWCLLRAIISQQNVISLGICPEINFLLVATSLACKFSQVNRHMINEKPWNLELLHSLATHLFFLSKKYKSCWTCNMQFWKGRSNFYDIYDNFHPDRTTNTDWMTLILFFCS